MIVGLSGLSLILGWDLFRRGIVEAQSADFKSKDWGLRLQKVGPGIFFALFATATFIFALSRPLSIAPHGNGSAGDPSIHYDKGPSAGPDTDLQYENRLHNADDAQEFVRSINTIQQLALPRAYQGAQKGEANALQKANETFNSYKKAAMFEKFGEISIQFYQIHDQVPGDPSILAKQSKALRDQYEQMELFDKQTFVGDPK
jgi:hypothetical protein